MVSGLRGPAQDRGVLLSGDSGWCNSRIVNNKQVDVSQYDAPPHLWRKWLNMSNMCKPIDPRRSFAEVLKTTSSKYQDNSPSTPITSNTKVKTSSRTQEMASVTKVPYLKQGKTPRVHRTVTRGHVVDPVPCHNRFDSLSQSCNEEVDETNHSPVTDHISHTVKPEVGSAKHNNKQKTLYNVETYVNQAQPSLVAVSNDLGVSKCRFHMPSRSMSYKQDMVDHMHQDNDFSDLTLYDKLSNKYLQPLPQCTTHLGSDFGAMSLTPLQTYTGPPTQNVASTDPLLLYRRVRESGLPNYMGIRVPVPTNLNIANWRRLLVDYWDNQLVDLLEFGFPLDFDRSCDLISVEDNHKSAIDYKEHVQHYLQEELDYGAILGPFQSKPINLHVSPFMTRDKPDSKWRRAIVDLSWPVGASVNAGVQKDTYLNSKFALTYPSVDHIVQRILQLGPGSLIYKIDISRAFRQLKVDPGDIDLLGLKLGDYYIDQSVPFGFRHGSFFFEKVTDSIRFIMNKNGFPDLYNYVDDLLYCGLPSNIHKSFAFLSNLLHQLGLKVNPKKLVEPSTSVICLGILINTEDRTISIPPDKLQEIIQSCTEWRTKRFCSKRQLQSLLGSLLYICKCVKPARVFLNRMLTLLRDNVNNNTIYLSEEFFKDLNWFSLFLKQFNGVVFYDVRPISADLCLDACLTGLGGVFGRQCYALPLPRDFHSYTIVHLEMLNVLVALKIWAYQWTNCKVRIQCDNMAVVEVLASGKTRDKVLATCSRNIWLLSSLYNITLQVDHIPGRDNTVADLLSRFKFDEDSYLRLNALIADPQWISTHIDLTCLNYDI